MSKFDEFYTKVMEDDALKAAVIKVLGDKTFEKASDEQLTKIGEIAKSAGFVFTIEEAKSFLEGGELDDDDLDAVAGGVGGGKVPDMTCSNGIGDVVVPPIDPHIAFDLK